MNNTITASRLNTLSTCLRKHYWSYEVGLRGEEKHLWLKVGSAWARAMEARWAGANYDAALAYALPKELQLDKYECAKVAGMLMAYYKHYGATEKIKLYAEEQFNHEIIDSTLPYGFIAKGKLDGIGQKENGRTVILEHKTTGDSIEPTSEYWDRLQFNVQLLQYVTAAREENWDIGDVIYDVASKPTLRPRRIPIVDKFDEKIVVDTRNKGKRVKNKDGTWRQSEDKKKGYELQTVMETPFDYMARTYHAIMDDVASYFVRKEVPIPDHELAMFERHRLELLYLIIHCRERESATPGLYFREEAWPRSVSEDNCKFCSYKSFCLANIRVNDPVNNPPAGFAVRPFNPELAEKSYAELTSKKKTKK